MRIRREVRGLLLGGGLLTVAVIVSMIAICVWFGTLRLHVVTLALLTTSGPLVARVFEGLVRRRQRRLELGMDCLEADDEVLAARVVPLIMPVSGALFSYYTVMA